MDPELVIKKFGDKYQGNADTYHMGIKRALAEPVAKRFIGHKVCLDTCLGAGFMALVLAKQAGKIIGIDSNPEHLNQAKENFKIAGLDNVEFVLGDVMKIIDKVEEFDCAFLDPDWAKVGDSKEDHVLSLSEMVPPADLLLDQVFKFTKNVCIRLPKEFDCSKLNYLPEHETEAIYLGNKLRFYCIYFGDLVKNLGNTELRVDR